MKDFVRYPFDAVEYNAVIPALDSLGEINPAPVAIIGGGPVGLTAALALARQGIRCTLYEADSSVCFGSRAICISRRSLEIISRLGAGEQFLETGLAWSGGRSYFRDHQVLHFQMPHDGTQKLPPMINIEQYYIEQFLLDAALAQPDLIEIRWQSKLSDFTQDANGVTLTITTPEGDYTSRSNYMVACDGGRSMVRDKLGLTLQGTSYEGRYVIADIHAKIDLPTERLAWFDPPSNPGLSILMHRQPDDIWRIDYQISADQDAEEAVKPENVLPLVERHLQMMGYLGPWSPVWITLYKAHALTLEDYRHGRVLLAGDAAHLVPIFGVRGANSGIDDADNLSWKLGLVVRGLADEAILDSYSAERVFAARENLSYGTKSAEFMAPPNAMFTLMREAVLSLARKHPELTSLINPRQTSAIWYHASPLNPNAALFEDGPSLGQLRPDFQLDSGWISDQEGRDFTLLVFGTMPDVPAHPLVKQVIIKESAQNQPAFTAYGCPKGGAYLLRPDSHVLARWGHQDHVALSTALAQVLK